MGYGRTSLGVTPLQETQAGGTTPTSFAMAVVKACASFRHVAADARDVASVWINWATVAAPGSVELRYETDDGNGKPSGTLYDAAATKAFTPAAGWQQVTFDVLPTAGRTADAVYHIVLIASTGGTTQTLRAYYTPASGGYPCNCLTASDGTTRSNLTEVTNSVPLCTVVYEDGAEEARGFAAFVGTSQFSVYGTRAAGAKWTVPPNTTQSALGVWVTGMVRNGAPDDLRVRVFDSGGSVVGGTTRVIPKGALTGASTRRLFFDFASAVSLAAGTYRIVVDQAGNASASGNNWTMYFANYRAAALNSGYSVGTTTADVTAGTVAWTDTGTDHPLVGLQLDDASGSGGTPSIIGG